MAKGKPIKPAVSTNSDSHFWCLQVVRSKNGACGSVSYAGQTIKLSSESIGSIYLAPVGWRLECSKLFKNVLPSGTYPPRAGQRFQSNVPLRDPILQISHKHKGICFCRGTGSSVLGREHF